MRIRYAGNTHVGMKRTGNEDNLRLVPSENLYMVADGMGGHNAGEVASKMAVDTVAQFFEETAEDEEVTWPFKLDRQKKYEENRLVTAVKLANLRIYEQAMNNPKNKGMGTTITALLFTPEGSYSSHVGDSRIYRVRDGAITQLTEDHSLLNDYIKMKDLTQEEIENFPHKNVIVRALGMKETVQVDVYFEKPQNGDIYLLCSDGLSGMISDDDMNTIVNACGDDLEKACNDLIELGNKNGGTDNITAVLAQFLED
jgi:PPM family protein phosphatase